MKKILAVSLLFVGLVVFPVSAQAHVLISDTKRQTGAVLHITPDDDPIAGELSDFYIEFDASKVSYETHSYNLSVTDSKGVATTLPMYAAKNTITARYAFPSQGVYKLVLTAEPIHAGTAAYRFTYTQRVARGVVADAVPAEATHGWAIFGTTLSVITLCCLGILGINNKRAIAAYSRQ